MELASSPARKRFQTFAWALLAYNILVILWGAYVRISFSGDGCGSNWPFCNGQVIPHSMALSTAIEYTHRMMTGLDTVAVVGLCVWSCLSFPRRHAVRRYSLLSLLFLFIEALLGAGLVLLRLVAKDQSAARALYLSAHLTNTLLLLAALSITAWLPMSGIERLRWSRTPGRILASLATAIAISVTGVIAALGDTLFPASSLATGMRQDFSNAAVLLLRLRLFHPVIAVGGATYLIWVASQLLRSNPSERVQSAATRVIVIIVLQVVAGVINLTLLAPVWMQLLHLLIADLLWIFLVVLSLALHQAASQETLAPSLVARPDPVATRS